MGVVLSAKGNEAADKLAVKGSHLESQKRFDDYYDDDFYDDDLDSDY